MSCRTVKSLRTSFHFLAFRNIHFEPYFGLPDYLQDQSMLNVGRVSHFENSPKAHLRKTLRQANPLIWLVQVVHTEKFQSDLLSITEIKYVTRAHFQKSQCVCRLLEIFLIMAAQVKHRGPSELEDYGCLQRSPQLLAKELVYFLQMAVLQER